MEFMDLLYPYEFIPHPAILLMHLTISAGWYFCEVLIAGERRCQLILPTASEVKSYSIFYACRGLRGELSSLWRPSTCPESRGHVAIWTPNKNKWYWYIYIYIDIWYLSILARYNQLQSIIGACDDVVLVGAGIREFRDGLTSKTTGLLSSCPFSSAQIWMNAVFRMFAIYIIYTYMIYIYIYYL